MDNKGNQSREILLRILERARWAPSGDNTQPWRFRVISADQVIVYGHDTRDEILYDFDGHASHMAHGALLETLRLAASAEGLTVQWTAKSDPEWRKIEYLVSFKADPCLTPDSLHPFIEQRTVQRRPMGSKALTDEQRQALVNAVGQEYTLQLFEPFAERKAIAGLLWKNARIRLTCPEAYPIHKGIIEWGARFSEDRIPEQAVGVDPMTAKLMRWVMKSWERVDFFNRYLMGTVFPRIQLDYVPAMMCSAHVLIKPKVPPSTLEDWVNLGATMQRVWLTVTQIGMHLQPEMTPVIFRWYRQANRQFSRDQDIASQIQALSQVFESIAKADAGDSFGFFGRIGFSKVPRSRSLRLSLNKLLNG